MGRAKDSNAWDEARRFVLKRIDGIGIEGTLDRGVNFFIIALEELGVQTIWSCEGHPKGFYIIMFAPYELALALTGIGFFTFAIAGKDCWRISIGHHERREFSTDVVAEKEKRQCLRLAASAWLNRLPTDVADRTRARIKNKA
jgi:hypothetical protein